jgi:putative phosphoesterase
VIGGATAFIADIHGNIWALDAVLADIRRRGIQTIFNLGDSVYGPLEPAMTAARLMEANIPSLRGNQDRILLDPPRRQGHPTLLYTMSCLNWAQLDWLRDQPRTIESAGFFLCHGTPAADDLYLTESVNATGVWLRRPFELEQLTEMVAQPVVLCGHSHIPRVVELPSGKLIVNPGSVGLPAYPDDLPFPHRMETGSPHARYAVIEDGRVDLIAVAYDYQPAVAKARENGREDWAVALATGFSV